MGGPMALGDLIMEAQENLQEIKRPWFVLHHGEAELSKRIREKTYRIHDEVVFEALVASRRMLIIDLGSFAVEMLGAGGLIGQIKARSNELPVNRKRTKDDLHLEKILSRYHNRAFERLFEGKISRQRTGPSGEGLDDLRARFDRQARDVIKERHVHAHRYQRANKAETTHLLSVAEIGEQFAFLEELLSDLLLVCQSSTYHYSQLHDQTVATSMPRLVDLILLGRAVEENDRDAIYEKLHADHGTGSAEPWEPGETPDLFNDYGPILRLFGPR